MNYISFIVKIIEEPQQSFFDNDISVTEILAKFYQLNANSYNICKLVIWGSLSHDIVQYYNLNDYLIIEGYISTRISDSENSAPNAEIEISVFKVYPFALNKTL